MIHDVNNEIPKISDGIIMPVLRILNKLFLLMAILVFLFSNFFEITLRLLAFSLLIIFLFYNFSSSLKNHKFWEMAARPSSPRIF